jgi:hypothetical protein
MLSYLVQPGDMDVAMVVVDGMVDEGGSGMPAAWPGAVVGVAPVAAGTAVGEGGSGTPVIA